ncbi:MAG TPA: hypothetical protein DCL31_14865 [Clostridium sp.]|nr:hypothetical protein [Clostridium sp.]
MVISTRSIDLKTSKLTIEQNYKDKELVDIRIENINGYITPIKQVDMIIAKEIIKRFNSYNEPTQIRFFDS